jgi:hypothetical protein
MSTFHTHLTTRHAGLTTADVARRYRVGEDKVRSWIGKGELAAINTAALLSGRPRWVITAEALAEFERRRSGGPPAKPAPRRRRKTIGTVDYFQ